jgi:hypothetical protein
MIPSNVDVDNRDGGSKAAGGFRFVAMDIAATVAPPESAAASVTAAERMVSASPATIANISMELLRRKSRRSALGPPPTTIVGGGVDDSVVLFIIWVGDKDGIAAVNDGGDP